jgi:hypothetical protein
MKSVVLVVVVKRGAFLITPRSDREADDRLNRTRVRRRSTAGPDSTTGC